MSGSWNRLAKNHGRKSVMSLSITDEELNRETDRQIAWLLPVIKKHLIGHEFEFLDYGCGYGRFTAALHSLNQGGETRGYDPCLGLLPRDSTFVKYCTGTPENFLRLWANFYDVVFTAMVLGDPDLDFDATVAGLVRVTNFLGTLVIVDHMDVPQGDRWWRMRSTEQYITAFASHGIELSKAGEDRQLTLPISVLIGRKAL